MQNLSNFTYEGFKFSVKEISKCTGGSVYKFGPPGTICTDTRIIKEGQWFLALKGNNFDGHKFIPIAEKEGCCGVIATEPLKSLERGCVVVPDTLEALQSLAFYVKNKFEGPVVAVTGSSGKTTTRSMIALALGEMGYVHQVL